MEFKRIKKKKNKREGDISDFCSRSTNLSTPHVHTVVHATCFLQNKSVGKTDCKPRKPDQVTVSAISLKWYIQTSTKSPSFISLIIPAKIWESLLSLYKSNRSRRQTLVPPRGNKIILKFSNVTYSSSLFVAWLKTKILFNEILNCWSFFFHHHFNALLK